MLSIFDMRVEDQDGYQCLLRRDATSMTSLPEPPSGTAKSVFSSPPPFFFSLQQSYESVSPGARLRPHTSTHLQCGHAPVEDPPGDAPGTRASHSPYCVAHHHGNHCLCKSPACPQLLLSSSMESVGREGLGSFPFCPPPFLV